MKAITAAVVLGASVLAVAQPVPVITHVTDPTRPGQLFNVVGADWDPEGTQVRVARLEDGEPGSPEGTPPGVVVGPPGPAALLKQEPHVLTCSFPEGRFGVYALRVRGPGGWSERVLINRPRADWLSTDRAVPGERIRILGRNLVGLDLYPERDRSDRPLSAGGYVEGRTRIALLQGKRAIPAPVEKMSAYDVHFRLPLGLEPGEYAVHVHNGYGGAAGWSSGLELRVEVEDPWPEEIFNVRRYGAVGDGIADDAPAIQGALDAAGAGGGGVVYLPPGSYLINSTLTTVHPRTVVRGQSRERTWIWLPNGVHYGDRAIGEKVQVGLQGDLHFIVEDLSMHGVYARYLILAPIAFSDHAAPAAENVTVRRCRLMMEPTLRHPYRRGEPFLENERLDRDSSWSNRFCVAVRGDRVRVQDSHLRGGGSCVHLEGGRYCTIQRNELLKGTGHGIRVFPGRVTPENNIIEDNVSRPVSNVHSATFWSHARANRYYIARNRFESDWCRDNENIIWHSLAVRLSAPVGSATLDAVRVDTARVMEWALKQAQGADSSGFPVFLDAIAGGFRADALAGYDCLVVDGRGLGQLRTIVANTVDAVALDRPWKVAPDPGSLVAICQNPQFQGHIVVDNSLAHTGSGINPWGNAYDMVIDGNRLALSGGIDIGDVGAEWTYREWAGNYRIQILNNTVAEGRYHGNWPLAQALHIFQGIIGLQGGASVGVGGLDWVLRNNRTETDALIGIVPPARARYRGIILEDNRSVASRTGIRVGAGVSGVLRGNTSEGVERPLWDEGSSLWMPPAEALRLQLEGLRTLLEEEGITAAVDWKRLLDDLGKQAARAPREVDFPALRAAALEQIARAVSRGGAAGTSFRVIEPLSGLQLSAASEYSLLEVLASGRGGRGIFALQARLEEGWPELEIELTPVLPGGWQAERQTVRRRLAGGEEVRLEIPLELPPGTWGGRVLPLHLKAMRDGFSLAAQTNFGIGRGDVGEWHLIGPFRSGAGADLDPRGHPPENRLDLGGHYESFAGEVGWKPYSGPARLELNPLLGSSGPRTGYALAVLRAAAPVSAVLELEAAGGARAWLNQAEVAEVSGGPAGVSRPVQLAAGDNTLVVKVSSRGDDWFLRAAVTEQGAGGHLAVLPVSASGALALLNPPRAPDALDLPHGGGVPWRLVHADDFGGLALGSWQVASGAWRLFRGAAVAAGQGAFLAYEQPLQAPLRIEYRARSTALRDMSCFWLADPRDYNSGYLFAFAAGGGGHRVTPFGRDLINTQTPVVEANRWYHVIAQLFASGRVEVIVDGEVCMNARGQPPMETSRYAGLWTWRAAEFDDVRLYTGR